MTPTIVPRTGPPTPAFELHCGVPLERELVTADGRPSDSCGNAIEERPAKGKKKRKGKR